MPLNDLSGIGGTGSSGIVSGVGGTGVLLSDVANSDTVEYVLITATNIINKSVTLLKTPFVTGKVVANIVKGPTLDFGIDYTVTGNVLSWSGLGLDGKISAGDKIRIKYFAP